MSVGGEYILSSVQIGYALAKNKKIINKGFEKLPFEFYS